jgi:OH-DDVA oxygenase/3-O-methylgallate 3,4-dioxygenase
MAKIVLAMATTHGPQLHTSVEQWALRVQADRARSHPFRGRQFSFDELVAMRKPEGLEARSTHSAMIESHRRCQAGMEALAAKWSEVQPDIAVILGNDQDEMFETERLNPAFTVFCGAKIPNYMQSDERRKQLPPGVAEGEHGHATEQYTEYDGVPELGVHLIETLVAHDFDVAVSKKWPANARNGAAHAFGHIYRQVMLDKVVPNVPIIQNTFFPPNQPSARRAYAFGRAVKKAIDSWDSDKTVAVFGSGGMSHFVIDEVFDRAFVDALRRKDAGALTSIPLADLQSGTSELKSWITLAGVLEDVDCTMQEIDYVPCYRSAAGTGTANGFYWWKIRQ